jgi:hypothetical protein
MNYRLYRRPIPSDPILLVQTEFTGIDRDGPRERRLATSRPAVEVRSK